MRLRRTRELYRLQAEEAELRSRGDYGGALRVLDRMLAIDPLLSPALNNKGGILMALERFADALPVVERATEADPKNGVAWNNLGLCLYEVGRVEEAHEPYRRARAAGYGHEGVLYNAGVAHFACGDLAAGIESWRASLSINPFQPRLIEKLGIFARAIGLEPDPDPEVLANEVAGSFPRLQGAKVVRSASSGDFTLILEAGGTTTMLTFE